MKRTDPPPRDIFELQARLCRVLSSPLRLRILHELHAGERSAGELREHFGLSRALLSQHMRVLQTHGLVVSRQERARTCYRLADPMIAVACELVRLALERLHTGGGDEAHVKHPVDT